VSVEDLARLHNKEGGALATLGALEVRQGALGLQWIAAVHPLGWRALEGEPTADEAMSAVEIRLPAAVGAAPPPRMLPVLVVESDEQNDRTVPCPSGLIDAAVLELKGTLAAAGVKVERMQKN